MIKFSKHAIDVMQKREIIKEWVKTTVISADMEIIISAQERHYFKVIEEADSRCLKVVLNPQTSNVITTYFDRNMRKKGCGK